MKHNKTISKPTLSCLPVAQDRTPGVHRLYRLIWILFIITATALALTLIPLQYIQIKNLPNRKAGLVPETKPDLINHPQAIPGYACYRTVEALYTTLAQTVTANYPAITRLVDYGDSWEKIDPGGQAGYDLSAVEITNKAIPGVKPVIVIDGGIHVGELAPPELAMAVIDFLTTNYGQDPDVTWLVDHHKIVVIPMFNPDGRKLIEAGATSGERKYKNTRNSGCADFSKRGTDLNRNFDFKWDAHNTVTDPCASKYRGPEPLSEPETASYATYVRSLIPDHWDYSDFVTTSPPLTASGILVNMHSPAPSILYPWAWTEEDAPNGDALKAMAEKYAAFNGYEVRRSYDGTLSSGLVRDWGYGDLGIPSFTLEMGTAEFERCSNLPGIIAENLPALFYFARIARTPYMLIHGPDVMTPTLTPSSTVDTAPVQLTATINDTGNGGQAIAAAAYYVDVPPWITTTTAMSYPMTASDGAFGQPVEAVQAEVASHHLSTGRHLIYIQGQDTDGNWGPFWAIWLTVTRGWVKGQVLDAHTSTPISGAGLTLTGPVDSYQTHSNASGNFAVEVFSDTLTLTATALTYYSTTITGVVAPSDLTTTLQVEMMPLPSTPTPTPTLTSTPTLQYLYLPVILKN